LPAQGCVRPHRRPSKVEHLTGDLLRARTAEFVGDLVHTALQIVEPETNSCSCEDPAESRATRHKLLGRAADDNALVFPAHLGGQGAAEIVRDGSKFAIKDWAGFARIS